MYFPGDRVPLKKNVRDPADWRERGFSADACSILRKNPAEKETMAERIQELNRKSNGDHSLFHQLLSAGNRDLDCPVKYIEDFDLAVHMCLIIVVIGYFYKQIAIPVLIDHPVIPSCRFSKSAFF